MSSSTQTYRSRASKLIKENVPTGVSSSTVTVIFSARKTGAWSFTSSTYTVTGTDTCELGEIRVN